MKDVIKWLMILIIFGVLMMCTITYQHKGDTELRMELFKKDTIK